MCSPGTGRRADITPSDSSFKLILGFVRTQGCPILLPNFSLHGRRKLGKVSKVSFVCTHYFYCNRRKSMRFFLALAILVLTFADADAFHRRRGNCCLPTPVSHACPAPCQASSGEGWYFPYYDGSSSPRWYGPYRDRPDCENRRRSQCRGNDFGCGDCRFLGRSPSPLIPCSDSSACPPGSGCPPECSVISTVTGSAQRIDANHVEFRFYNAGSYPAIVYPVFDYWNEGRHVLRVCDAGPMRIEPHSPAPVSWRVENRQGGPLHGTFINIYHSKRAD
jgi:hypothetical protein